MKAPCGENTEVKFDCGVKSRQLVGLPSNNAMATALVTKTRVLSLLVFLLETVLLIIAREVQSNFAQLNAGADFVELLGLLFNGGGERRDLLL